VIEIFDAAEHEPFCEETWNVGDARDFIARIVRETDDAFEPGRGWPLHPEDQYGPNSEPAYGVYCGSAGTMWALKHLAGRYGLTLKNDYGAAIAWCEAAYREKPGAAGVVPSYFIGTVGILLARFAITGEPAMLDRIADGIRANLGNATREAL